MVLTLTYSIGGDMRYSTSTAEYVTYFWLRLLNWKSTWRQRAELLEIILVSWNAE